MLTPFDEAAGLLLDELLRVHRAWGRHRAACDLSAALEAARGNGMRRAYERIENIIGEFGDNVNECAAIIGEHVGESLHVLRTATPGATDAARSDVTERHSAEMADENDE